MTRWSFARRGKEGKYGATRTESDGYSFASKLEAAVYQMLKARKLAGEITDIKCQEQVELSNARIIFKPDFSFIDVTTGEKIWTEAKGLETPEWRIKKRLWKHYGPGRLQIWMGSWSRPIFVEEVKSVFSPTEQESSAQALKSKSSD